MTEGPEATNKMYELAKIDFQEDASCYFCNRGMPTCVVRVLRHNEEEIVAGPTCAKKHATSRSEPVLNFTRGFSTEKGEGKAPKSARSQRNTKSLPTSSLSGPEEASAIEYLLLRQKLLPDLGLQGRLVSYSKLAPLLERQQDGNICGEDITYLINLERSNLKNRPKLSRQHLRWVYTCLWWTLLAIKRTPEKRAGFLLEMKKRLQTSLLLTDGQLVALNRWLQNIEGAPQIAPSPIRELLLQQKREAEEEKQDDLG